MGAVCSPVNPEVAYVEIRGGDYNLYTLSLDGGTPSKVTSYTNTGGDINQVWFANWSRDGSKFVFSHGTSQYTSIYSIWIISASGGTPEQYSEDPEGARAATAESVNFLHPSFSPDGTKLVAQHHGEIWLLEL
jgi:Tol biopolymer transport system component